MTDTMTAKTGGTPAKTPKRAAISGFFGGILEYYDFSIYAQAAALIFPLIFFPKDQPGIAVIASLATYAVGYVARPLGAIVMGHFGDRVGRKSVLVFAMLLMGVSTFCVGLLPTFQQVGMLAPVLLVVLRVIQGFAVSGELGGASAMIIEHAPEGRRGFFASFPLQGTQAGSALGSAVFIPLTAFLPQAAFQSWGWRIPFFLSAVVVLVGLIIRSKVEESPSFEVNKQAFKQRKLPIVELLRKNWKTVVLAVLMCFVNVIGTNVIIFGTTFATNPGYGVGMSPTLYLWIPVVSNLVAVCLVPWFGALSDRFGRKKMMLAGSIPAAILMYPYLFAVEHKAVVVTVLLAIALNGIFLQMWNATFASFFQELFPMSARVTGFSLSQNVSLALVAFTPSILAILAPPGSVHVPMIAGTLCLVVILVAAVATLMCRETSKMTLEELG